MEFSKWWVNEFKTIKFPSQGTIFDYYIDSETKKFMPWTEKVPTFRLDPEVPLQVIPTHCLHLHPSFGYYPVVFPPSSRGPEHATAAAQVPGLPLPRRAAQDGIRHAPGLAALCFTSMETSVRAASCNAASSISL